MRQKVVTKSSDGATTSDNCNFPLLPWICHPVWKGHKVMKMRPELWNGGMTAPPHVQQED